jgi:hypothetical protein
MIAAFLWVLALWMLTFGGNIAVRLWLVKRHRSRHDVIAEFPVQQEGERARGLAPMMIPLIGLIILSSFSSDEDFLLGLVLAVVLVAVLWLLYKRSATRTTELLLIDREGMSMFAPRPGYLGEGTFHTRLLWKDCFGYSVYRETVLFALHPIGHVEQQYGEHREAFVDVLDKLGIRKLIAYDVLADHELTPPVQERLEARVRDVAADVIAGYGSELTSLGMRMTSVLRYEDEKGEEGHAVRRAVLRLALWEGPECLEEQDAVLWSIDPEAHRVELFSLPDDRVYETLDERAAGMIEARQKQLGQTPRPLLLQ